MTKKLVLSGRLVKSKAVMAGMTLTELNDKAGFSKNYIGRLWDRDNMQLSTIVRVAKALEVGVCDLLEEREVEE
jgi:DNA-binding Xre family transcriptional regulator